MISPNNKYAALQLIKFSSIVIQPFSNKYQHILKHLHVIPDHEPILSFRKSHCIIILYLYQYLDLKKVITFSI